MNSTISKSVIATGCSSGLVSGMLALFCSGENWQLNQGFELVKQLLGQTQPYKFILGARDTKGAQAAYDRFNYDSSKHKLSIFPLELSHLNVVKSFALQILDNLGKDKVDYLLLNAAVVKHNDEPGPHGSKWSEAYIVNHLCE